jgi:hypothetical protein
VGVSPVFVYSPEPDFCFPDEELSSNPEAKVPEIKPVWLFLTEVFFPSKRSYRHDVVKNLGFSYTPYIV